MTTGSKIIERALLWYVHTARHRHRQIVTVLNGIVVLVQCEHLHTILYNPFFIGVCIGLGVGQREHTITLNESEPESANFI